MPHLIYKPVFVKEFWREIKGQWRRNMEAIPKIVHKIGVPSTKLGHDVLDKRGEMAEDRRKEQVEELGFERQEKKN